MAKDVLLVELYAGLASLSLWCVGGKPVLGRRGSKASYAEAIAARFFGGRRPTRFLLNDADAGVANALAMLVGRETREEVARRIDEWSRSSLSPIALWRETAAAAHPNDPPREAARWLLVSAGSAVGDEMSGCAFAPESVPRSKTSRYVTFAPSLATLAVRARAFPLDASFCNVRHGPAETLAPILDAIAYLDPPYASTQGYGRVSLLPPRSLCEQWARAGCKVALSETLASQAPLGWPCHDLTDIPGTRRDRQMIRVKGRRELLFVSP